MPTIRMTGKVTRSHGTASEAACEVVNLAINRPEVSKVSLSYIENIGGSRRALKFQEIYGGVLAKVRGAGLMQSVYIYTNDPEKTKRELLAGFNAI